MFAPGKQLIEYKNLAQVGTGVTMENDLENNTASVPLGTPGRDLAYGGGRPQSTEWPSAGPLREHHPASSSSAANYY